MYANRMFHTTELLKHAAACLKHKFKVQCPVLIQQSRYGHMKEVIRMKYFAQKYSKQIITQKGKLLDCTQNNEEPVTSTSNK